MAVALMKVTCATCVTFTSFIQNVTHCVLNRVGHITAQSFYIVVRRPRYDKRTEERHFKLFKPQFGISRACFLP